MALQQYSHPKYVNELQWMRHNNGHTAFGQRVAEECSADTKKTRSMLSAHRTDVN